MNRRTFLTMAASAVAADGVLAPARIPIIDTHIHLFDPTRPQGVPWPEKSDKILYKPAMPERFKNIAEPHGVVGAIEVEASPWLEDNQWVLDVAAKNPIIVGTVGDLEPGTPDFRKHLDRFHKNPLFRGIRYGNIWGRDLGARLSDPLFVGDLRALADADLELDTANPTPQLVADVVRLSDKVPKLRVVIDHLPQLQTPDAGSARKIYESHLSELGSRPQVYVKVSEVLRRVNGRVSLDGDAYRDVLDHLWTVFGSDRLMYGSDWPNGDLWGTYSQELQVVRQYFAHKGRQAAEKFFWKNSVAAYRWIRRDDRQPGSF